MSGAADDELSTAMLPELRAKVPEHVVFRAFDRETVLLNLETGKYFGLDPIGGRLLELLSHDESVGGAVAAIAREYDHPLDEVERDIVELCRALRERGLVELRHDGAA